jgi:IS605 OrfB family transposase
MQHTLRFRLNPTPEQARVLLDTLEQHADCFNVVAEQGWKESERNGVTLHKATYYPLRAKHPALPAQLVIAARVRATEAIKSALTRKRQGKQVSCPRSNLPPIRYDQRSYTPRLHDGTVSLATVACRQVLPVMLYPYAQAMLQQTIGFDSADLIYRRGRFLLHVVVTLPDANTLPNGKVVGIDFGMTRPAVTSDNRFFGERRWKNTERRYFRLKRRLQRKGSPSTKRHLRRLARKVSLFRADCDHVVSRRIVQSAGQGTTLVVENLLEIRQRTKQNGRIQRRAMHQWSYRRLRALLDYKAEAHGCTVVGIDPRHTSQRCSRCGYIHRSNRRSQSRFVCRTCGYELNADLNGARNIAAKYLAGDGKSVTGGLPVKQPIVTLLR